jgi:ABC-type transport system involved in multi-copper enzyme maturation permease subunit
MANALLYDFKRTLTSKSVIITVVVMVLISFAFIALIYTSTSTSIGFNSTPNVVGYYDSNGFHFITYGTNQFGQGISGYTTNLNLTYAGKLYTGSGTTNSSGFSTVSINAPPNPNYTISVNVVFPGGAGSANTGQSTPFMFVGKNGTAALPGQVVSIFGTGTMSTVPNPSNSSQADIRVFYVAPFGKVPTNFAVYYKLFNLTTSGPLILPTTPYNESQMQFLGTLSGYVSTFSPPTVPAGYGQGSYFYFEIFYPNATLAQDQDLIFVYQLQAQQPPPIQTTNLVSSFFSGILSFFIPIVAIIGSYNSYGKDKVNGVLESVLSRPITRRGLSISRYLSTFLAMAVAIGIGIAVLDGIVYYFTHSSIDSTFLAASTLGFFVELAAFIGIMFFLSHLVKSSGLLIGIGIGLFLVLDFFWSLITLAIAFASHASFGSIVYYEISAAMQFVNPAQFVSLITTYLTNQAGFGQITPAQYGITIPSIVAAGILWIAVPFAIFLYLATHRD